jgi:putative membrane protein
MNTAYLLSVLHLLTFGLGFGSCWARAVALKRVKDNSGMDAVFLADNLWGLSALLWIVTGLWRAFGGLEKGTDYYLGNTAFQIKIGLFILIFMIELRPMVTFIKWRMMYKRGETIDLTPAPALARLSYIELILLIPIVFMAAAMSRGMLL